MNCFTFGRQIDAARFRVIIARVLLLVLLLVLPFNIVYHFNSEYAYVDGYFVNYLDFVVHIVDIVMVLLLGWLVFGLSVWRNRKFGIAAGVVVLFGVLHNLWFRDVVVLYSSTRLILYIVTGLAVWSVRGVLFEGVSSETKVSKKTSKKANSPTPLSRVTAFVATVPFDKMLLFTVLVSIAVQVVIALLQFQFNRSLGLSALGESQVQVGGYSTSSVSLPGGIYLRGYGTFPHPNVLGGFFIASLILIMKLLMKPKSAGERLLLLLSVVGIGIGILATWSRVSIALYILSVLFFCGKLFWDRGRAAFLGFFITLVAITGVFGFWAWSSNDYLATAFRERFVTQSSSGDVSVRERYDLMRRSFDMISGDPLVGVGAGRFISSLAENPVIGDTGIRVMQPVHNVFLLALSEVGIFGVATILLVTGYTVFPSKLRLPMIMACLFVMAVGMMDHYLWTLPQGMGLMVLLLLVA